MLHTSMLHTSANLHTFRCKNATYNWINSQRPPCTMLSRLLRLKMCLSHSSCHKLFKRLHPPNPPSSLQSSQLKVKSAIAEIITFEALMHDHNFSRKDTICKFHLIIVLRGGQCLYRATKWAKAICWFFLFLHISKRLCQNKPFSPWWCQSDKHYALAGEHIRPLKFQMSSCLAVHQIYFFARAASVNCRMYQLWAKHAKCFVFGSKSEHKFSCNVASEQWKIQDIKFWTWLRFQFKLLKHKN